MRNRHGRARPRSRQLFCAAPNPSFPSHLLGRALPPLWPFPLRCASPISSAPPYLPDLLQPPPFCFLRCRAIAASPSASPAAAPHKAYSAAALHAAIPHYRRASPDIRQLRHPLLSIQILPGSSAPSSASPGADCPRASFSHMAAPRAPACGVHRGQLLSASASPRRQAEGTGSPTLVLVRQTGIRVLI
jgi:hypothetical protein